MFKLMRTTPNRHWREIHVSGREQIVIETDDVKVTVSTGTIDADSKTVTAVNVVKGGRSVFEHYHRVPQTMETVVRTGRKL